MNYSITLNSNLWIQGMELTQISNIVTSIASYVVTT